MKGVLPSGEPVRGELFGRLFDGKQRKKEEQSNIIKAIIHLNIALPLLNQKF